MVKFEARSNAGVGKMSTITKKELIDRIAEATANKRVVVKRIIQFFLDEIIDELGQGNRLEFRDFGVFESRHRAARTAQNPKTLERVDVPSKRTVKFKVGRLMKQRLQKEEAAAAARIHNAGIGAVAAGPISNSNSPVAKNRSTPPGSPLGS